MCSVIHRILFLSDINECRDVNCSGNGVCFDRVNGFNCVCNSGFFGDNCELGKVFFGCYNIDNCSIILLSYC